MDDREHEPASLLLIDTQISELEQRLDALQEVIMTVAAHGGDTGQQAALLQKMLRMRRALQGFRSELWEEAMSQRAREATQ